MTSTKNILLSLALCLSSVSLFSVSRGQTSALPTDPDRNKENIPALESNKAQKINTPDVFGSSLEDLGSLFGADDDILPALVSIEPTILTEPLHTKIKQNITYSQPLSSIYGGEDSEGSDYKGSSGYAALNNGLFSIDLPRADDVKKADLIGKMHDSSICEALFAHEDSTWRSSVIKRRIEHTLKGFLEDQQLLSLLGTREIPYREITSMDFYLLQTRKAVVVINEDTVEPQKTEVDYLARLIPGAALSTAQKHAPAGTFTIAPQELYDALEQEAKTNKVKSSVPFEKRMAETYLAQLPTLAGEVKSGKNKNEVCVAGEAIYTQEYGPKDSSDALNGSWPSSPELKELAERELRNPTNHHVDLKGKHIPVRILEFTQEHPLEERITNSVELNWIRSQLEKKPKEFTALFLVSFEKEWTSCVITKSHDAPVTLTVIDPHNKDRHEEKGMAALADAINEGLTTKASPEKKKKDPFKDIMGDKEPEADAKKNPGVNYDAPLVNITDDELPSLEDFFGDKIPNEIVVCIKQLKREIRKSTAGDKLKNGILLYGPPGTGKSTIAQIMARKAGRSIVYAGGGDFRDAYQGSGKAKLDALFAEAKKRGNCIILIDEIDGTSNRLQPHNSTQEDNRAIKSLITTLDQYRHDPDIFVICTTNYPENIDAAIMRRFKRIEIPLPDYPKRKNIVKYYLKQNGIKIASRTPNALSPDFYDKLVSATDGFSGDALGDMINNAVYEYEEGLKPESRIGLGFRFQGIDVYNKSLFENLGELLLLPMMPVFMAVGESDLDKHVYSQYKRQLKIQADIKENERKNDPNDKFAKEPFFTRIFKRNFDNAGTALERGCWDMAARQVWHRAFSKVINVY